MTRAIVRAPYTEQLQPHAIDMSAPLRPSLPEMTQPHVETRDHIVATRLSSDIVLFVVGHVRGSLRYTDIHGQMYGKWIDRTCREI